MKHNFHPVTTLFRCDEETPAQKKRRYCRAGAGVEQDYGKGNTPGFPLRDSPEMVRDFRGFMRLELPRNHRRILQTSLWLSQGWRANCDIQFLLYDCDPSFMDPSDIAKVTDYIVAYTCKGVESLWEEKAQTRGLILGAEEADGDIRDVKRLARRVMNKSVGEKLYSKQETMVHAAGLDLFHCTQSFERISLSGSKRLDGTKSTFMSEYSRRTDDLQHLSLHQFFRFRYPNKVAVYTGGSCTPVYPVTKEYAQAMIMIHDPWQHSFPVNNIDFIQSFEAFLLMDSSPDSMKIPYERAKARFLSKNTHNEPTSKMIPVVYDEFNLDIDPDLQDAVNIAGTLACSDEHDATGEGYVYDFGLDFDWCQACVTNVRHPSNVLQIRHGAVLHIWHGAKFNASIRA